MSDERDRGLNLWMVMREQETRVHVAMETSVMNETSGDGTGNCYARMYRQ